MIELLFTFAVGVAASVVSGIAGGGGGLISAPFFIFIGLPPQIAVATTKFGALGLTLGSIAKFRKTEYVRKEYVLFLSILSVVAAILGSQILLISSNENIERIVGAMMLVALPFSFIKDVGIAGFRPAYGKEVVGYVLYFFIG